MDLTVHTDFEMTDYQRGYSQAKQDALAVCDDFIKDFHDLYLKERPTERAPYVRELYTGCESAARNIKDMLIRILHPPSEA